MEIRRYTDRTRLTNYYPLPRGIVELHLSSTAMILYALLLDRATLSQKNDYTDDSGWVYVVYPIEELCRILRLSSTTIKDSLRCLERKGLIRRIRLSRREANRLFLCLPEDSVTDTLTDGILPSEGRKSGLCRDGKAAPSNRKKQQDNINTYQHSQEESF